MSIKINIPEIATNVVSVVLPGANVLWESYVMKYTTGSVLCEQMTSLVTENREPFWKSCIKNASLEDALELQKNYVTVERIEYRLQSLMDAEQVWQNVDGSHYGVKN